MVHVEDPPFLHRRWDLEDPAIPDTVRQWKELGRKAAYIGS